MATPITEIDILIRLGLGFIAGAIIGFERSSRHQVAGLRTHILIAMGAALLMLLSIWLPQQFSKSSDPGRIAAQVVSGMGFLGAGAIIRLGNNIKGLTTAASMWFVAAVGMTIGAGMYVAAAGAEALGLITLMLLHRLEHRLFPSMRDKLLELHYSGDSNYDTKAVQEILENFGIKSQSINVKHGMGENKATKIRILVSIPDSTDISKLAKTLKASGDAARVEIKEKY